MFAEAAARALTTVRQVMPARLRLRIDARQITAVERPGAAANPEVDPEVIVALSAAVRAREVLRFDYVGAFPPRRAERHHLITWGGRWYLVAWDLDRADWRTFRADRIPPRTPTGPRFTPRDLPGGSWPRGSRACALGRFDADIEVVGPTELADAFSRLSRRYAAAAH